MNKLNIIVLGLIIIILIGFIFVKRQPVNNLKPTPLPTQHYSSSLPPESPIASPSGISYCAKEDLQALLNISPAAGNIYGTFTLKNISQKQCQILGSQFITAQYDTKTVKNITITHQGDTQKEPFIMTPNQTIYSQLHYPNGPQCQSIGLIEIPVTYTYQISPKEKIAYQNPEGKTEQIVYTCHDEKDITEINFWQMSKDPITP